MSEDVSGTPHKESEPSSQKEQSPSGKGKVKDWNSKLRRIAASFWGNTHSSLKGYEPAHHFDVLIDQTGGRQLIEIDNRGVIKYVAKEYVGYIIGEHLSETIVKVDKAFANYGKKDRDAIYDFLLHGAPGVKEENVAPIATASEGGLTWHRLPFDLNVEGETPTFDDFFSRMENNANAIKAWIGSLFDEKSSRIWIVVLYGEGGEGKGRFLEYLKHEFDNACTLRVPPDQSARQWFNSEVYNKRIVGFTECDEHKFFLSDKLKGLTGNNYSAVNGKFKDIVDRRIICKMIFATNKKPSVERMTAHSRRLLYTEIKQPTGDAIPEHEYDARLRAEGPAFITKCWREYQNQLQKYDGIKPDKEAFDDLATENEIVFEELVDRFCMVSELCHAYSWQIDAVVKEHGLPPGASRPFINFLKRQYKITYKNQRLASGKQVKAYWGIGIKMNAPDKAQYIGGVPEMKAGGDVEDWKKVLREGGWV